MERIWDVLQIEATKDRKEIKKAYARLSKEIHPEEKPEEFQLNEMLLHLVEAYPANQDIRKIEVSRIDGGGTVVFRSVPDEEGRKRSIRRSNVRIRVVKREN